jgi:hypothetical protein
MGRWCSISINIEKDRASSREERKSLKNSSPPAQVLVLGEHRNTLRSEDGVDAEAFKEIGSCDSEEEAELGQGEQPNLAEFLDDIRYLLYQP